MGIIIFVTHTNQSHITCHSQFLFILVFMKMKRKIIRKFFAILNPIVKKSDGQEKWEVWLKQRKDWICNQSCSDFGKRSSVWYSPLLISLTEIFFLLLILNIIFCIIRSHWIWELMQLTKVVYYDDASLGRKGMRVSLIRGLKRVWKRVE